MSDYPYYLTWGRQADLGAFPVRAAEHDEFVLDGGRRVYDFISTSFQTNFGHSCAAIRDRVHEQLDAMPVASPKASFDLKQTVSERLIGLLGLERGKLFYTTSGSESVENALKMARQARGTTKVLARSRSYHGASLGALSVTGDWRNEPHFTLDSETIRIPEPEHDPDLSKTRRLVEQAGAENIAAVILETITGANGVVIPNQAWYDGIASLCQETGILLIADEVLCGFGRTGADFAFQHYGLKPDLVCLSKGITGGYVPFGAVWTGPKLVDYYRDGVLACGLTCYAHPLGLAALEGVLDLMSQQAFRENLASLESVLKDSLAGLESQPWVKQVRIKGMLAAIDLVGPAPTWREFFDRGLHLFSKGSMIVVGPPLVSTPERLEAALTELGNVLTEKFTAVALPA